MSKNKRTGMIASICVIVATVTAMIVAIKIDEKKTGETIMQAYEKYILDHKH